MQRDDYLAFCVENSNLGEKIQSWFFSSSKLLLLKYYDLSSYSEHGYLGHMIFQYQSHLQCAYSSTNAPVSFPSPSLHS